MNLRLEELRAKARVPKGHKLTIEEQRARLPILQEIRHLLEAEKPSVPDVTEIPF